MQKDLPPIDQKTLMNAAQVLAIAAILMDKEYFEIILQDFKDRKGQNCGNYIVTVKKV